MNEIGLTQDDKVPYFNVFKYYTIIEKCYINYRYSNCLKHSC